jgi:hypothetical protein
MGRRPGPLAELVARLCLLAADFVIVARPGRPTLVRGRLPVARVGEIESFFGRDLRPEAPVTVRGSRTRDGTLRLTIAGRLDPGRRQRVRNFLLDLLR